MLKLDGKLRSNTEHRARKKQGVRLDRTPVWVSSPALLGLRYWLQFKRYTHRDSLEGVIAGSICSLNRDRIDTTRADA